MLKALKAASAAILLSACCTAAFGHEAALAAKAGWGWQAWPDLLLLFAGALYIMGCWRLQREQHNLRRVLGLQRGSAFVTGMLVLVAALVSPLDALAAQLFSAHMTQHILLMMVAPPLLVCGRALLMWLWAFPLAGRRSIGCWWNGARNLQALQRFLMQPLPAWLLASAALWLWHIPGFYDAALSHEWLHGIEHACFFLTSLAFWTLVIEPYRTRGGEHGNRGTALLAVVGFALHSGLLGALLTFASAPLYRTHNLAFPALSPLQDQQLAGLIMWVPASVVYLTALSWLLAGYLRQADQPSRPPAMHSL